MCLVEKLQLTISSLNDLKDKIDLLGDTCCFSTSAITRDEIILISEQLEDIILELDLEKSSNN